jgi:hypothetical protein
MIIKRCLQLLISFLAIFSYAQQGNYKFNNFGNRSILLSGNVTGSVTDIGLTYYNPSRLTEVENTGFAFNAKAYQLSSLKVSNVFVEDSNINSTSFNGVPSMAGGTFSLFGTRFGYSFISKSRADNNISYSSDFLRDNILNIFPNAEAYRVTTNLRTKVKDDWFGLTWAKRISEKFSLGISAFGSNYEYSGGSNLNHTIDSSDRVSFYQNTVGFSQKSYGLFVKLGANYHFKTFDLGVNVNLPYIEVYNDGRFNYNKVISGVGTEFDQFYSYDLQNLTAQRREPLGVSAGAGIPVGKGKLHLNIDYVHGLSVYNRIDIPSIDSGNSELTPVLFKEERKDIVNFGAGFEIHMTDRIKSYLSFSTDYNAFIRNANIFDLNTNESREINIGEDFMHYSFGIDLKLNFASIILGTTYTNSSAEFINPTDIDQSGVIFNADSLAKIEYSRWQFVVGIEIPVLEKINPIKKEQ